MSAVLQNKDYQAMAEAILKARPNLISVPLNYNRQRLNPIIYAERVRRSPKLRRKIAAMNSAQPEIQKQLDPLP